MPQIGMPTVDIVPNGLTDTAMANPATSFRGSFDYGGIPIAQKPHLLSSQSSPADNHFGSANQARQGFRHASPNYNRATWRASDVGGTDCNYSSDQARSTASMLQSQNALGPSSHMDCHTPRPPRSLDQIATEEWPAATCANGLPQPLAARCPKDLRLVFHLHWEYRHRDEDIKWKIIQVECEQALSKKYTIETLKRKLAQCTRFHVRWSPTDVCSHEASVAR